MKDGTESQTGRTMQKGRWEWICSSLQILARSIPKEGFHIPVANLLSYRKKKLALELGLQKNDFGGKGFGWGVQMQIYLQEERRHLKPRVSNAWLIRGTGSCSAWLEHHFHKDGINHWKGRLGPRSIHGTARYWTGYMPKTKLPPLRSLQL